MAFTSTLVALLQKDVIRNLDKKTVIFPFANRKFEGELRQQGDTVTIQTLPSVAWNRGQTAGAAISDSGFTVTSESLTITEVDTIRVKIPDIDAVRYNRSAQADASARIAEGLAQNMDKFTASFVRDALAANKLNETTGTGAGQTLTASNVFGEILDLATELDLQNVPEAGRAVFVTPTVAGWLTKGNWIDSTDKGVGYRVTGAMGKVAGMAIYRSNNIPFVTDLFLDTNPTATNTFVIAGVTFTIVANGTAAAPGDISLGGSLAVTQASIIQAINGTGTPGASNYIALSAANRLLLKKAFVVAKAFGTSLTNAAPIYSAESLAATETFTAATNIFHAEGRLIFALDSESINVVTQLTQMKNTEETDAFASNILGEYVYDGKVFAENSKRIATNRIANG